jgi:hypothetical protein
LAKKVAQSHAELYILQSDQPAAFLKHDMAGFLEQIRFGRAKGDRYNGNPEPKAVRLLDGEGRRVWWAGYSGNEGSLGAVSAELDACSPIVHSQLALRPDPVTGKTPEPPRCPAD